MRHLISTLVVAAVALPVSAVAQSETINALLTQIHGAVLVDAGKGFVPASEGARLKVGDRVMVAKDGQAVLSYGGDCSVPLEAPSITAVEETACSTTTQGTEGGGGGLLFAAGITTVAGNLALLGGAALGDDAEAPVSP